MKVASIAALAALGIALSGCASIVSGWHQDITVSTTPAIGAVCTLTSSSGTWTVATPGIVTVRRSKNDIAVTCTKDGHQVAVGTIPSGYEAWTLGDVALGSLGGIVLDISTGAVHRYPDKFDLPLTPVTTLPNTPIPEPAGKPAS
jgi:hypothetical protein